MPGVGGLEILPVLRSMCPHGVIAVISAHIPPDLDEDTSADADVIIAKPIHAEAFGELVDAAQQIMTAREKLRSLSTVSVAGQPPDA